MNKENFIRSYLPHKHLLEDGELDEVVMSIWREKKGERKGMRFVSELKAANRMGWPAQVRVLKEHLGEEQARKEIEKIIK